MAKDNVFEFARDDITIEEMYKLMIGSVVPRPIAWVSTRSMEGVLNLAPFSFLPLLHAIRRRCSYPLGLV